MSFCCHRREAKNPFEETLSAKFSPEFNSLETEK